MKLVLVSAMLWLVNAQAQTQPQAQTAVPTATTPPTAQQKNSTSDAAAPSSNKPVTVPANDAGSDKLTLDTTVVSGNRELPKVLYIVPWKKAELGELPGQPFNSLLEDALAPVDREVFRREVEYYGVIAAKDQPPASPAGDSGGK